MWSSAPGATAAWVDLDGFVVAITTREVPLLPNAIALAAGSGALARSGVAAGHHRPPGPGRIDLGPLRITWRPVRPPAWDPTVPVPSERGAGRPGSRRGSGILRTGPSGLAPPHLPTTASSTRDPADLVGELAGVGLATAVDPGGRPG